MVEAAVGVVTACLQLGGAGAAVWSCGGGTCCLTSQVTEGGRLVDAGSIDG